MKQLQSKNSKKSLKSFKKNPKKYQNMVLVASSVGYITDVDYNAKAVEFSKYPNNINAQVMLNSQFEIEEFECLVSSSVTVTLLYGRFLWKNPPSPSGLSASMISSEGLFCTETLHE